MGSIVKSAAKHLRKDGLFWTGIAAVQSVKRRSRRWYYTKKVRKTAEHVEGDLSVNGPSSVNEKTTLGYNVNFNGLHVRGDGQLTIGDNFHSGPQCHVLTRNHNFDSGDKIPYDDTYIRRSVDIGDNVWVGIGVTILPGVSIGEGAIVQAGSTVVSDIPDGGIAGGHPAKVFDYRDMEHYERLKREGQEY